MFVFGNTAEMLQFCQGYKLDAINLGATANHDGADQVGGKDSSVFLTPTRRPTSTSCSTWASSSTSGRPLRIKSVDIDAKL